MKDRYKELKQVFKRLRKECPWDRKQTFRDLSGYLLEECYEVLEALAEEDLPALEGELGDLFFQVIFLARLGQEQEAFDLASVSRRIHAKMVSRHPHVFGESEVRDEFHVAEYLEKPLEPEELIDAVARHFPDSFAAERRAPAAAGF